MLVNHEKKIVFLHNPKCGGISITEALLADGYQHVYDLDELLPSGVVGRHRYDIPVELADYFSFCTVRHPYELCLSAWRYMVCTDLCKPMSFMDWIVEYGTCITHQEEYIKAVKQIVRLEELHLISHIIPDVPKRNVSDSRCFYSDLTPEIRRLIYCIFRKDFELTNYRR